MIDERAGSPGDVEQRCAAAYVEEKRMGGRSGAAATTLARPRFRLAVLLPLLVVPRLRVGVATRGAVECGGAARRGRVVVEAERGARTRRGPGGMRWPSSPVARPRPARSGLLREQRTVGGRLCFGSSRPLLGFVVWIAYVTAKFVAVCVRWW